MINDDYTQVKWDFIPTAKIESTQIEVADDVLFQLAWAKELVELPEVSS